MFKHLVCSTAILVMAASNVFAQARIVESQPVGRAQNTSNSATTQTINSTAGQAELYYQMQTLQQEVQELRGLVEQQAYELKQLKQQRLDDYLDLDRRLSQKGKASSVVTPLTGAAASAATAAVNNEVDTPAPVEELASYRAAIDLVLKERDFDAGVKALKSHLDQFPEGHYAANAQYWLGQIYLQQEDLAQSRDWFARMIKEHPDHQKAPEAKFKLGKVYHLLGDDAEAKKILQDVAKSNVPVASLAEDYLKQNF